MRNMSFSATTEQIRNQTKHVTRRMGWKFLRPGDLVQPIEKGQGLKKGEKVVRIGPPIRIVSARQEILYLGLSSEEVTLEGFPDMSVLDFLVMFCKMNQCAASISVTRIEFEYTDEVPA